jgi:hypothetical protein
MVLRALTICFVLRQDGLFPEIADQIQRSPEGYYIFEKKQPQKLIYLKR